MFKYIVVCLACLFLAAVGYLGYFSYTIGDKIAKSSYGKLLASARECHCYVVSSFVEVPMSAFSSEQLQSWKIQAQAFGIPLDTNITKVAVHFWQGGEEIQGVEVYWQPQAGREVNSAEFEYYLDKKETADFVSRVVDMMRSAFRPIKIQMYRRPTLLQV